jgi:tRNA pseudouridine65 synthase
VAFRILYQDENLVAIDKPSGFYVHPPEDTAHRAPASVNCLHLLRKQIDRYLYPVHRLDRATSGVLIYALNVESARYFAGEFQNQKMKKTYFCVSRGWTEEGGIIDHPQDEKPSVTSYERIGKIELPRFIERYPTSRYSLNRVVPHNGRMHQIRRHFTHISHPLIGDTLYGDGKHNRFFRDELDISGLLLRAYSLEFLHPETGKKLRLVSHWKGRWQKIFDLFGVCPLE